MADFGASPYLKLYFDEQGKIDPANTAKLAAILEGAGIADLVVLAHGWKNSESDAETLYETLWRHTRNNFPVGKEETIAVAGVIWPSKAYQTDFDAEVLSSAETQNTLSAAGAAPADDLPEAVFNDAVAAFQTFLPDAGPIIATAAREASQSLTNTPSFNLVKAGAKAVGMASRPDDRELATDAGPFLDALEDPNQAQFLLASLQSAPQFNMAPETGATLGLGETIQGLYNGGRAAVARLLNQFTYYEMKKRAGLVGAGLANEVLKKIAPAGSIRIHLLGHSFGGRLVTATAEQLALPTKGHLEFFSLTLLQGAFSHNALAKSVTPGVAGAFPDVVGRPTGPITITHTHNDLACTLAYALASRLSRDTTTGVGDASDEFGAMGANGPQKLDHAALQPENIAEPFHLVKGKVNPVLADKFIVKTNTIDAHNNVATPTTGRLFAATIQA
jgi:hypothetical protein